MPTNPSATHFRVRFHVVAMLVLLTFIVGLTGSFLFSAFSNFEDMAEDSAQTIFRQLSVAGAGQLQAMLDVPGQVVQIQAEIGHPANVEPDSPYDKNLEQRFISALNNSEDVYGYFIGLANGHFFQVMTIRGDPNATKALDAPQGTWFAVHTVASEPGKPGLWEIWRFLSRDRKELSARATPAKYDARTRPWYKLAIDTDEMVVTNPYTFFSNDEVGLTIAQRLPNGIGVMAADVSIQNLNKSLSAISSTPNSVTVLVDQNDRLVALGKGATAAPTGKLTALTPLAESDNPFLTRYGSWKIEEGKSATRIMKIEGRQFVEAQTVIPATRTTNFRIFAFAPMSEFSAHILSARNQMVSIAGVILLLTLPMAYVFARRGSRALGTLSREAERIQLLDFRETPPIQSIFKEIDNLGRAQHLMKESIQDRTKALLESQAKLENLIHTGLELGRERDRMGLLRKTLYGGRDLLHCDAGTLYLVTERKTLSFALRTKSDELPSFEIPLYDAEGKPVERFMATWCALHNEPVIVDDVYSETRFDVSGAKKMDAETGYRTVSMLTVPLAPREGEVIGVLQFLNAIDQNTHEIIPFDPELIRFVTAMAAQAAVALDNHQLVESQKELMESLIKLIAGAIDAKSPYTGGHCERVPELGIMLAEEASKMATGPFAHFRFETDDEWREFRIGAWLHDCGKVTTPEYVVDKATKLETIHNRIHEIRMRFEVLLRDAQIDQLESIANGKDPVQARSDFEARKTKLIDDFSFVAECNLGGEFMAPDQLARLKSIAAETWIRHFDDRLGLAHEELKRYPAEKDALPISEMLLADKPQHIIPRSDTRVLDPKWGFKVTIPEHLYNYGEMYNLSIGRGTLTEEERFKINEHVIQSLMMLEQLPLPKNMKRVPEYAGTHHETLAGTGYPRKLTATELTVPMRIMAIADIFEALTASDRPYKKAKTLSESVKILSFFKKDGHIDPDLFDLFLSSGVYKRYAEKHLLPEQIDQVDIDRYL